MADSFIKQRWPGVWHLLVNIRANGYLLMFCLLDLPPLISQPSGSSQSELSEKNIVWQSFQRFTQWPWLHYDEVNDFHHNNYVRVLSTCPC